MNTKRAYNILLRLYPRDHRALFAAEMSVAFEEAAEASREQGRAFFLRFALAELTGLVAGAGIEWAAKFTHAVCYSNISPSIAAYRLLQKMRPPGVSRESFFKIIDLMDGPGAGMIVGQSAWPDEAQDDLFTAQERLWFTLGRLVEAISSHEFEKARFYSDQESRARENLRLLREKYKITD